MDLFLNQGDEHVVVIEEGWKDELLKTTLYLYELDPVDFHLQDPVAGNYVSYKTVKPVKVTVITDVLSEFKKRDVSLKFQENLHPLANQIIESSFDYSLIRMRFAKK